MDVEEFCAHLIGHHITALEMDHSLLFPSKSYGRLPDCCVVGLDPQYFTDRIIN